MEIEDQDVSINDSVSLSNSHFPDSPNLIRPDVRIERCKGGSKVYLNDHEVPYPIEWGSISVRRHGQQNILTLSLIVGDVEMDSRPRPEGVL